MINSNFEKEAGKKKRQTELPHAMKTAATLPQKNTHKKNNKNPPQNPSNNHSLWQSAVVWQCTVLCTVFMKQRQQQLTLGRLFPHPSSLCLWLQTWDDDTWTCNTAATKLVRSLPVDAFCNEWSGSGGVGVRGYLINEDNKATRSPWHYRQRKTGRRSKRISKLGEVG